jgi:signal peptidase
MSFNDFLKKSKNLLIRFWRSDNNKVSILRDILVAFLIVFIILIALWTYTGQWFSAPMVAIESGSMMHENEPFGRYGTIDAGDMVLLVKVKDKSDIVAFAEKDNDNKHYGKYGDVVIYHPDGLDNRDQIIHRAMCWVEVENNGSGKTYTIEECGIIKQSSDEPLYCPEYGINSRNGNGVVVDWDNSGFITKGDNEETNPTCDQIGGIASQPVKVQWISGKARAELPWIGTINLFFNDITSGKNTVGNVPGDSLLCLAILIIFLISIPVSMDIYSYYKDKKKNNIL